MTRILSIDAAIRYNVHDDRNSVRRVKISKLRILPTVPKKMNEVKTIRVACTAISRSIFLVCKWK
jgi:hypothetical protein